MDPTHPDESKTSIAIQQRWLNQWAEAALRIGHLNTLALRELENGSLERARALFERARTAATSMFNEMIAAGAEYSTTDPEYPYVHWHRGLACEALGQGVDARKQFDMFGQGLIASGRTPTPSLIAAVREKFRHYDLDKVYVV